jgi:hypothetical protein
MLDPQSIRVFLGDGLASHPLRLAFLQLAGEKLFFNLRAYPSFIVFGQVVDGVYHFFICIAFHQEDKRSCKSRLVRRSWRTPAVAQAQTTVV